MSTELILRTPDVICEEIKTYTASMLLSVIEIGRRFAEAREIVPHGEWMEFVERTGYSKSSANNFMRIFEEYGDRQGTLFGASVANDQTFGQLSYSKALALLSVPREEREEFAKKVDAENLSTRELQKAIKERDDAMHSSEEARAGLAKEIEELKKDLEIANQTIEDYKAADEKDGPSEEEIRDAVNDALKEERDRNAAERQKEAEERTAEIDRLKKKIEKAEKAKEKAEAALADAKAAGESAGADAKAEAEKLRAEAEALRRELAMANPVTAEFKGIFGQVQTMIGRMIELRDAAADGTKEKLTAALAALKEMIA